MSSEVKNVNSLDDILRFLGQFRRYQLTCLGLNLLVAFFSGMNSADYLFSASSIPIRCAIPECEDISNTSFLQNWTAFAIPDGGKCVKYRSVNHRPYLNRLTCSIENFNQSGDVVPCDDHYVYGANNSIFYDFELHCDESKRAILGTAENIAYFAVLPAVGLISDKYGRKAVLVFCSVAKAIFGFSKSFATTYNMFLAIHTVQAVFGSGAFSTCFIMSTEYFSAEKKTIVSLAVMNCYSMGVAICGLLAWSFPNWRTFLRMLYGPQFLTVIYVFILDDSARWLLSKGKHEEARAVLNKTAKINNNQSPRVSIEMLKAISHSNETSKHTKSNNLELFKQVLNSATMRLRAMVIPVWWISSILVYYGLSINSVGLAGNMYLNFILVSLIELPGEIIGIVSMSKIGRKKTLACGFLLCALGNYSFTVIPSEYTKVKLAVYIFGKLFNSVAVTTVYTYTVELYPTEVRHTLFALSSTVGRIGSILAPQTPLLMNIWTQLPMVIFGTLALVSSLSVLLMPETLGTKLPESIEEAERMSRTKNTKL